MVSQHSHIKIWETLIHLSFPIVSSHTCSQSCWWPDHDWHCDYRSSSISVAVYILFFPVCVLHFVFFLFSNYCFFSFIFPFAHLALMLPGAASSELSPLQTESIDDSLLHISVSLSWLALGITCARQLKTNKAQMKRRNTNTWATRPVWMSWIWQR